MAKLRVAVLLAVLGIASSSFEPELHAKFKSMKSSEFVEYFNSQGYSWKMREYDDDQIDFKPCAKLDPHFRENVPEQQHAPELLNDLPQNFDAREKWPQCETIKAVNNQGSCGSCWTFGSVDTASDRTCIHKNVHVRLSEQELSCLKSDVCEGGIPSDGFVFWQLAGLVSYECKPYDVEKLLNNECKEKCLASSKKEYYNDKHYAEKFYSLANRTEEIKAELFHNGPIQASFMVYEDFKKYDSGVYSHKYGEIEGGHSVRVIGYGVEKGENYWLVANSWGEKWGDHGLVKIKAFDPDLGFEQQMVTGLPKN